MAFFDALTGDAQSNAADKNRALLDASLGNYMQGITNAKGSSGAYLTGGYNSGTGNINSNIDAAIAAILGGKGNASGFINQGYGTARNDLTGGYTNAQNALTGAYNTGTGNIGNSANQALGYLDQSQNAGLGRLDQAGAGFDTLGALGQKYGAGSQLYLDALGANGQTGTDRARQAFQAGPGYDFNLTQGLDAINRRRAAGGMLDSGNADRDAQTFGAGLASQEYNNWLNNLQSTMNPELQATSGAATGRAGLANNAAGLISSTGANKAQIEQGRGKMLSDLAQVYGTGSAGLAQSQGRDLSTLGTDQAKMLSNLETQGGQSIADLLRAKGISLAGLDTAYGQGMSGLEQSALGQALGVGNNYTNATMGQNKNEADALTAASGNSINLAQNLAKLLAGSAAGGGGMFSNGSTMADLLGYGAKGNGGGFSSFMGV